MDFRWMVNNSFDGMDESRDGMQPFMADSRYVICGEKLCWDEMANPESH